jgi:hypothetical protein
MEELMEVISQICNEWCSVGYIPPTRVNCRLWSKLVWNFRLDTTSHRCGKLQKEPFVSHGTRKNCQTIHNLGSSTLSTWSSHCGELAIGDNEIRKIITEILSALGYAETVIDILIESWVKTKSLSNTQSIGWLDIQLSLESIHCSGMGHHVTALHKCNQEKHIWAA